MKVLHICESDTGGAGIAAQRLNDALCAIGVDSKLLCVHKNSRKNNVVQFQIPVWARAITHIPISYRNNKYRKLYPVLKSTYESISFPTAVYQMESHPLVQDADIINLHWIGSVLNYPSFFKRVVAPIVWTLHDMNPFLGIAHFSRDQQLNPQWAKLENKVQHLKTMSIHKHKQIHVVELCKWMQDYSTQSIAFKKYPHSIIYNSLDVSTFKRYDKKLVRLLLGLPDDRPIFLFCAQYVDYHTRKGIDILDEVTKRYDGDVLFLVVGSSHGQTNNKVIYYGAVNDSRLMAMLYSAADAYLLPSREDNLPNTMLEALCCGTPVIAFKTGGMVDIIKDYFNGILVSEISTEAYLNGIKLYIEHANMFDSNEISGQAHELFAPERQANAYYKLYNQMLNNE